MIGNVALLICGFLLVGVGTSHAVDGQKLKRALLSHRILARRLASALVPALIVIELVLGVGLLASFLSTRVDDAAGVALSGAASALFLAYSAYLTVVFRTRHRGLPCGCGDDQEAITPLTIARAATLAVLAAAAGLSSNPVSELPAEEVAVAVLAASALAILLWRMPAALVDPYEREANKFGGWTAGALGAGPEEEVTSVF